MGMCSPVTRLVELFSSAVASARGIWRIQGAASPLHNLDAARRSRRYAPFLAPIHRTGQPVFLKPAATPLIAIRIARLVFSSCCPAPPSPDELDLEMVQWR